MAKQSALNSRLNSLPIRIDEPEKEKDLNDGTDNIVDANVTDTDCLNHSSVNFLNKTLSSVRISNITNEKTDNNNKDISGEINENSEELTESVKNTVRDDKTNLSKEVNLETVYICQIDTLLSQNLILKRKLNRKNLALNKLKHNFKNYKKPKFQDKLKSNSKSSNLFKSTLQCGLVLLTSSIYLSPFIYPYMSKYLDKSFCLSYIDQLKNAEFPIDLQHLGFLSKINPYNYLPLF